MVILILRVIWFLSIISWGIFQYQVIRDVRKNDRKHFDEDNIGAWVSIGIMWVSLILTKIL